MNQCSYTVETEDKRIINPQEQTVVFAATKHHVEYLKELLSSEGLECAYIYSALDQTARKINNAKFVHRKAMVLLVTDVAARGIDIPLLDNVINYNFPSKAKLFLHRVGRVGRAGRSGTAYSLICPDEMPYVYDLHLFLGRPVQFASPEHTQDSEGVFGRVPQRILDDESAHLITSHENSLDLQNLLRVSENAYKQYLKSRPNPSPESIRRVKNTDVSSIGVHPVLGCGLEKNGTGVPSNSRCHQELQIQSDHLRNQLQYRLQQPTNATTTADCDITEKDESDLNGVFSEVVGGKRRGQQEDGEERPKTKKKRQSGKDEEYYIPYRPKDFDSERGLNLGGEGSAFEQQASSAVLDLMGDEGDRLNQQKKMMKWDRKRKRFVRETGKEDQKKKIKTDSGQVISNKKNRKNFYEEWKKKYKIDDTGSGSDGETGGGGRKPARGRGRGRRGPNVQSSSDHKARSELKTKDQIIKQRKKKQKHQFLQGGGMRKLRSKNKKWLGEVKKSGFGRGGHKKGKLGKKL
uniref:RNA helicase n=1 Tax=Astatotilapia calliptera TaxID=8154 RepID=A0AAX7TC67_ASTCA